MCGSKRFKPCQHKVFDSPSTVSPTCHILSHILIGKSDSGLQRSQRTWENSLDPCAVSTQTGRSLELS